MYIFVCVIISLLYINILCLHLIIYMTVFKTFIFISSSIICICLFIGLFFLAQPNSGDHVIVVQ